MAVGSVPLDASSQLLKCTIMRCRASPVATREILYYTACSTICTSFIAHAYNPYCTILLHANLRICNCTCITYSILAVCSRWCRSVFVRQLVYIIRFALSLIWHVSAFYIPFVPFCIQRACPCCFFFWWTRKPIKSWSGWRRRSVGGCLLATGRVGSWTLPWRWLLNRHFNWT